MRAVRVLAFLSLAACAGAPARPPAGPLARLAFMTGCWRGPDGDGVVEERIGPADSTTMLSMARYLHGDRVTSFEFLQIDATPDGAVMIPYLRGKISSARFALRPGDDGTAVFEDPTHEFPRRVIYRRDGAAGLVGRIEGEEPSTGKEWRMRRCEE